MKTNVAYVVDSYAVMVLVNKESGFEKIAQIFSLVLKGETILYMNEMQLGEIYYTIAKRNSDIAANEMLFNLEQNAIEYVAVDRDFILAAAKWKAKYNISYADSFVVETAFRYGCPILSGDPELALVKEIKLVSLV